MSDEIFNKQLVLIGGESATGKSASLRNIRDQENTLYLNAEAGKRLPFRSKFKQAVITDPMQVPQTFKDIKTVEAIKGTKLLICDSLTFLMDMYESTRVLKAKNKMEGWSDFQQYFKELMQVLVASANHGVIFTAHTKSELNEATGLYQTSVPIKGALKGNGIEAYFSTVVHAKKMPLTALEKYQSDLLHITEDDEIVGYKHVFQTQVTKETVGDRIRSPMGMFSRNETFMDNDAQLLLDRLNEYYN